MITEAEIFSKMQAPGGLDFSKIRASGGSEVRNSKLREALIPEAEIFSEMQASGGLDFRKSELREGRRFEIASFARL